MFLANILDDPVCQPIKKTYERWYKFMEETIEFWLPDSEWHTKAHCARVLLLSLLIGHQKDLSDEEKDALGMAAVFHDSRRLDDGIDKGHGSRAAEYYKDYCREYDLPYDEQAYYITYYHDQDDSLGLSEIAKSLIISERGMLLYQIFKDADGLDRFRLGPDALDVNFLRTEEAHGLVEFAKYLLQKSSETNS
ncbi:HD domain-containing protein [Metabacillus rhizolycopersici]|uniref:HD domain-containing protein n=1 Tax=Metabacillus rhizolycopersici TaxID=2875709 RepID=A0ABS7UNT4_9BACI|nr:HD domain-containing protein [Metabacillus rhizolycopersici]MBZ5749605.1 HD domain-containing protein [Metabacillus rhizolycopersici]